MRCFLFWLSIATLQTSMRLCQRCNRGCASAAAACLLPLN